MVKVVYSNSNCIDIWNMFISQEEQYSSIPLRAICNVSDFPIESDKLFLYNDADDYYEVWTKALLKFDSKYFIYLQEDFVLYDKINDKKIDEYVNFLEENEKYSFVRLMKAGVNLSDKLISDKLYEIEPTNPTIFGMQATIWRTSDYIKLMWSVQEKKWLETEKYKEAMMKLGMYGLYHYDGEKKRGGSHWDSNVYPCIATAIVRGKWNMREYSEYLQPLAKKYNIDLNKRGIF